MRIYYENIEERNKKKEVNAEKQIKKSINLKKYVADLKVQSPESVGIWGRKEKIERGSGKVVRVYLLVDFLE